MTQSETKSLAKIQQPNKNKSSAAMVSIKFALVAAAILALAKAVEDKDIKIVSEDSEVDADGKYHYNFENSDGTKAQQNGEAKVIDKNTTAEVVHGAYSYTGKDGQKVSVTYVADENGYQPQGDVLPVAPPIPPQIARALAYIAAHPQKQDQQ